MGRSRHPWFVNRRLRDTLRVLGSSRSVNLTPTPTPDRGRQRRLCGSASVTTRTAGSGNANTGHFTVLPQKWELTQASRSCLPQCFFQQWPLPSSTTITARAKGRKRARRRRRGREAHADAATAGQAPGYYFFPPHHLQQSPPPQMFNVGFPNNTPASSPPENPLAGLPLWDRPLRTWRRQITKDSAQPLTRR